MGKQSAVSTELSVPQEEMSLQLEDSRWQMARRGCCSSSCPDGGQRWNGGAEDKAEQSISLRRLPQCQSRAGCSRWRVQGDTPLVWALYETAGADESKDSLRRGWRGVCHMDVSSGNTHSEGNLQPLSKHLWCSWKSTGMGIRSPRMGFWIFLLLPE